MPGEHLYTHDRNANEVLLLDVEDGSTSDSFSVGGTVTSTLVDLDGNIYVGLDDDGEIIKFDRDFNEQWRWSDGFNQVSKLFLWPERGHVYVGEDGRFHTLESDSGDHLHTNFSPNDEVMDFTRDEEYIYTCSYNDSTIHRVDPDSGDEVDSWSPQYSIAGIMYYSGEWIIAFSGASAVRIYDGWDGSNYRSYLDVSSDISSNLVVDGEGVVYLGDEDAGVWAFDLDSLETKWDKDVNPGGNNPWITSISVTPNREVFVNDRSDETISALDGENDGEIVWQREDVGFFIWESFSAWPQWDIYGNDDWFGSIDISGNVTKNGDYIENAEILIIDDDEEEFVSKIETDEDGNWSTQAPKSTLHIVAQYIDSDGNKHNVESYPYITE